MSIFDHRIHILIFNLLCTLVCIVPSLAAAKEDSLSREYQIKAAYIYNLIKFINWPEQAQSRTATNICVYGQNPFGDYLDQLTKRSANGKPINTYHFELDEELSSCHIVFFSKASEEQISKNVFKQLQFKNYLNVGETRNFVTNHKGVISLAVTNNKVRLLINLSQAKSENFEISSNLLEIAEIIM